MTGRQGGAEGPFSEGEWAAAGRALLCCSGLACLALALTDPQPPWRDLLRIWVGSLGIGLSLFALWRARG
jgi:hypothetical protein